MISRASFSPNERIICVMFSREQRQEKVGVSSSSTLGLSSQKRRRHNSIGSISRSSEGVTVCAKVCTSRKPSSTVSSVVPSAALPPCAGRPVSYTHLVLGIIYESRPNVTVDAACLAIKSGNACILRGGSEAFETNRILGELVQEALTIAGLPTQAVQIAPTTDRAFVGELIRANKYIDVIIPRGGKGLISRLAAEATVPMIHHLDGICHTYVDKDADIDMADVYKRQDKISKGLTVPNRDTDPWIEIAALAAFVAS